MFSHALLSEFGLILRLYLKCCRVIADGHKDVPVAQETYGALDRSEG